MVSKHYLLVSLILQTLQQLRDVYGDSVDKIVQGNTSNIIFLKSTDDSMLDTLQKMSGTTHRVYTNSKTITRNTEALFQNLAGNEGKVSYTQSEQEIPVISYNDMAFISERNSIVFRAGDSPIWNRNETILPMSWRLYRDTISQPGKKYSFQTIPTLSSAKDFDVRQNQPNFDEMLKKRMAQAMAVGNATDVYMSVHGYTSDYDIKKLDPDTYAASIMEVVNMSLHESGDVEDSDDINAYLESEESIMANAEENTDVTDKVFSEMQRKADDDVKRYAGEYISRSHLISRVGGATHSFDNQIVKAFTEAKGSFTQDSEHFSFDGNLKSADGSVVYIKSMLSDDGRHVGEVASQMNEYIHSKDANVYSDYDVTEEDIKAIGSFIVTDAFYKFLASQPDWNGFADGEFERRMARLMRDDMKGL